MKKVKEKENVLGNNLYILKLMHKASPARIPLRFIEIILSVATDFLFNVFLLRLVINGVQTGRPFSEIVGYITAVGVILIVYYILNNYYEEIFLPVSKKKIYKSIQREVFKKAEQVDLSCYENPEFYDKYMRAVNETSSVAEKVLSGFAGLFYSILTVFSVSLVIFLIDPVFILFAIVPIAYSFIFSKKLNRLRYDLDIEKTADWRRRDYIRRSFYLADYAKEMRLTGISNVLLGRFFDATANLKRIIRKRGLKIAVLDYFSIVIRYVILYFAGIIYSTYKTVVRGTMMFGDCVVVINNIVKTSSAIQGVIEGYMQLHSNALSVKNLRTFLEYEPKVMDGNIAIDGKNMRSDLSLRNVSFSYTDGGKEVLKNISINIAQGEKIALVGHNGAGKTTLVKLLLRLYDPTAGEISFGGRNIKEYRISDYRDRFSAVFQHYKVFSMSLLENVLLKKNVTASERGLALEAMRKSGIYDKAMSLEHREDTVLTREFDMNGTVLSGGENQKVAIARVFTKPCDIVVLDEPSSALDPIAEYKMYEAMMKACENKSVVYISHRLSSAVLADRIYLLENGEVAESGTHAELLRKRGKYADMWDKQSEQYKESRVEADE